MFREVYQNRLNSVLSENVNLAAQIEENVFVASNSGQNRAFYEEKMKQLVLNLNPSSYIKNYSLKPRLLAGELNAEQLVHATPQELFPEKWEETIRENREILTKQIEGSKLRATTDMYVCGKCKKRECSYYEQQTRSADEPMTKFIKCVNCGHQWKQ